MAKSESPEKKDAGQKGRSKHRSPNYPLFSLEKAVERIQQLYDKDKTHKVPVDVVHDRWGYKKHSGAGNQAVAAVKSYGLVTVDGNGKQRQVAVTENGRKIILSAPDRPQLLKTAALGPALFNSLWEKYRETGIPSDEVLRHYLVFERKFNEDVVANAIERFKDTVAYAKLTAGDKIEGGGQGDDGQNGDDDDPDDDLLPPPRKRRTMQSGMNEDVFSLAEGAMVLQWPERLSKVSAQDAQDWLDLIGRKIKRASDEPPTEPEDDGNGDEE